MVRYPGLCVHGGYGSGVWSVDYTPWGANWNTLRELFPRPANVVTES